MTTDTEIRVKGYKALDEALGQVDAERFVSLLLREPFDYTKWRRDLWADKSVEEISKLPCSAARRVAEGARAADRRVPKCDPNVHGAHHPPPDWLPCFHVTF